MTKKYDTQNVIDMFTEFGQVFVSWIDDFSALVYLKEEKHFKKGTYCHSPVTSIAKSGPCSFPFRSIPPAVTQMVGVPGNDYKVYFYKTYLSKIKEKSENSNNSTTPNYTQAATDMITKRKVVEGTGYGSGRVAGTWLTFLRFFKISKKIATP